MPPKFRAVLYRGWYYAAWRERGAIRRISLRTKDREAAERELRSFAEQYEIANRPKIITVEHVWNGYRETLKGRPAFQTMGFEARSVLPFFSAFSAESIKDDMVSAYISRRRNTGRKDGTIWTELGRLRSALRWAERKGLIAKAPFIPRPAMSPPRDLRLTRQQAAMFLSSCISPHIRVCVILAMTTGARIGALLSLTWDRVNLESRIIDLNEPFKFGSKRRAIVPINRTLMAALQEAKRGALSSFVVEWNGRPVKSVKKGLATAGRRCGLEWVAPHVFRHSAASWMAEAGISMDRIAAFLGHSDSRITARVYARFAPDYLRDAAEALEISLNERESNGAANTAPTRFG
jgi:integrase